VNVPRDRERPVGLAGGFVPVDPDAFDDRTAARIAGLGFTRLTAHFGAGLGLQPDALDAERCRRLRELAATHGLEIEQSWGFGANLVADPAAPERLAAAMRVARDLGATGVIGGCGTMAAPSGYAPHPDNHTAETRRRLVARLREVAARGEDAGVACVLEPHVCTTLESPEVIREIVDAVGSPFVRVNLDPANLVSDLRTLWDSTAHVERCVDVLADVAVSGHVKDVYAEDALVVHLSETVIGDGLLDLGTYVRRFAERLPGRTLYVEHLPASLVPRAKAALDALLAAA
jgi:sugar phosphate isomerase/epimerase